MYKIRFVELFMSSINNSFSGIRSEYGRVNKKVVIILPVLLVFIGIFVRWVCGSPIETLSFIGARSIVPASWLMVLFFSIYYILSGLALGFALGLRFCVCGEKKYQGAMWLIISLAVGYAWYPVFFCARLFLVSAIMSAVCLFASICATACFASVSKLSFFLLIACDCWLIYLFLLNMQVFFTV